MTRCHPGAILYQSTGIPETRKSLHFTFPFFVSIHLFLGENGQLKVTRIIQFTLMIVYVSTFLTLDIYYHCPGRIKNANAFIRQSRCMGLCESRILAIYPNVIIYYDDMIMIIMMIKRNFARYYRCCFGRTKMRVKTEDFVR